MPESKFLKYQDRNNDLLSDTCEEEVSEVTPTAECDVCKPDACATVPSWKNLDQTKPFFNGKNCMFQITVETELTTTGYMGDPNAEETNDALREVFASHALKASEGLLMGFNKSSTSQWVSTIASQFLYDKYYLSPRENSRLKLLYSIPYRIFMRVPPGEPSNSQNKNVSDDLDGSEGTSDAHVITYTPSQVAIDLLKVRKTLNLYERYRSVFSALDGGNLIVEKTKKVFKLGPYGDSGMRKSSLLGAILIDLDSFINSKGYNMASSPGKLGWGKKNVEKFTISLSKKYKITKLELYTSGCDDPYIIQGQHLKVLRKSESFKDPTAMAYFSQLSEMLVDIEARTPMPWLEFVKKYTYPSIVETYNWPAPAATYEDPLSNASYSNTYNYPPNEAEDSAMGIIRQRLQEEGKQLGQDILSPIFGLGEAIAHRFNENLCDLTPEQVQERKTRLGLVYDGETDTYSTIFAVAQEQAFKILDSKNTPLTTLCDRAIALTGVDVSAPPPSGSAGTSPSESDQSDDGAPLVEQASEGSQGTSENTKTKLMDMLADIKVCGLTALTAETISCLMKGLTLEESLSKIIMAAFRSMPIENFGELFILLPTNRQIQIEKLASKKLKEGNLFKAGSDNENVSLQVQEIGSGMQPETLENGEGEEVPAQTTIPSDPNARRIEWRIHRPWQQTQTTDTFTQNQQSRGLEESEYSPDQTDSRGLTRTGTLAKKYQNRSSAGTDVSQMGIMEAYYASLIEVYRNDLLLIVDLLNKFPGAETVAKVLATVSCPRAPIIEPSVMDFIHDVELPFCRNNTEITLPYLRNPLENWPKRKDLTAALKEAAKYAVQQALITIITKILVKICSITGSAMCQVADTAGDAVFAGVFPNSQNDPPDRGNLSDIIATSILGSNHGREEIDSAVVKSFLFGQFSKGFLRYGSVISVLFLQKGSSTSWIKSITEGSIIGARGQLTVASTFATVSAPGNLLSKSTISSKSLRYTSIKDA